MEEKKKSKLIAFSDVELKGETIKEVFFLNVSGGEKTFLVFESGNVLVMPVYKGCPMQFGAIEDLRNDFELFIGLIEKDKLELDKMENRIMEIAKWDCTKG